MAGQDGVILYLKGLTKTFSGHAAVDNIDLEIREGELFTIVGPSGSDNFEADGRPSKLFSD